MSFQHDNEGACAAANVENMLTRFDVCSGDEFLPCTIEPHQTDEGIVHGQKHIAPRRRKKVSLTHSLLMLDQTAPKARNMIARGKREARRPWIASSSHVWSPERAK
jgi:hypothetical protein